jgi:hypothetical protein
VHSNALYAAGRRAAPVAIGRRDITQSYDLGAAGPTVSPPNPLGRSVVFDFFDERGLPADLLREISLDQGGLLAGAFDALDAAPAVIDRAGRPPGAIAGFLAMRTAAAEALRAELALGRRCLNVGGLAAALPGPVHRGRGPGGNILYLHIPLAAVTLQVHGDVTATRVMLVSDRRSVGRFPPVAPLGERDDHRLEVQPLLRQVVLPVPRGRWADPHEPLGNEKVETRREHVGRNPQTPLKIGEPCHRRKGRVAEDEQAPALARDLECACRRADLPVIGSSQHRPILADYLRDAISAAARLLSRRTEWCGSTY